MTEQLLEAVMSGDTARASQLLAAGADVNARDAYGATAPAEFFAVACEAYFVNRERFALEFPGLVPVLDAFFRPGD